MNNFYPCLLSITNIMEYSYITNDIKHLLVLLLEVIKPFTRSKADRDISLLNFK